MYTLSCKDMGLADCDFVAKGETPDDVMKIGMEHGAAVHGMKPEDMTEEKKQAAMAMMKQM